MRASKSYKLKNKGKSEFRTIKSKPTEIHISGAEGIYEDAEVLKIVREYLKRALNHSRGMPDKIVITIEDIKQKPKKASLLPITTVKCYSDKMAKNIIEQILSDIGISKKAITNAFDILTSSKAMRGASLILKESGIRAEPDRQRGVRVSRLGIQKSAKILLSRRLSKIGINTTRVKEAITLASKVASCPDVLAEVCISDDPDYTTGYISSKKIGYVRIPNIKRYGQMHGGRVFFIKENADISKLINYLEKTPVILS